MNSPTIQGSSIKYNQTIFFGRMAAKMLYGQSRQIVSQRQRQ